MKYLIAYGISQLTDRTTYNGTDSEIVDTDEKITQKFLDNFCKEKTKSIYDAHVFPTTAPYGLKVFVNPLAVTKIEE